MVLEKTHESPLDCKSILKEISPEYSLEGLMLKQRADSLEKTLMLVKNKGSKRRG